MRKTLFLLAVTVLLLTIPAEAQFSHLDEILHPAVEPRESGYLKVSEIHELYWELVGNPEGIQVIFLHGGPGGGISPLNRRFFDPEKYNVLLFDQRGAGQSRPAAEWRENNTDLLIEDINRLREHVGFSGPAIIFGGSWGSTLGVAYAETYPELVSGLVLRGVFLASRAEIDHFYHGGVVPFFPENFKRLQSILPNPEEKNYPEQLFTLMEEGDEQTRQEAIDHWAYYEIRMVSLDMTAEIAQGFVDQGDMTTFSVLENWYMMNGCFLEDEQLLNNAGRIAHIPTYIVNGRYDAICPPVTAIALAEKLNTVKLDIPVAAHSWHEPPMAHGLMSGLEWVAGQVVSAR
jgi:proline iminopeptidase